MVQAPDVKGGGAEVINMGSDDGDGTADAGGGNAFSCFFFRGRKNTLHLCRATRTAFFSREGAIQNVI
jgi:hypothetical protein